MQLLPWEGQENRCDLRMVQKNTQDIRGNFTKGETEMTNALKFAASKSKYKNRTIDWYKVWERFAVWDEGGVHNWKEAKLYIERLIDKELRGKK